MLSVLALWLFGVFGYQARLRKRAQKAGAKRNRKKVAQNNITRQRISLVRIFRLISAKAVVCRSWLKTQPFWNAILPISMREMLEAGVHFGHQTRFWNPKMSPFIYGSRNKVHIFNLDLTVPYFEKAQTYVRQLSANRGTILFVGTKRQSRESIAAEAARCGMPHVNSRWLGGLLTNFKTVKASIKKLKDMKVAVEAGELEKLNKKEALLFMRQLEKLEKSIGGIENMMGIPDALFVIDVGFHKIAIAEARALGIPVVGVVDTNHSPEGIDYVIPGNDDSSKAVALYARAISDAVIEGRDTQAKELAESLRVEDAPAMASEENA